MDVTVRSIRKKGPPTREIELSDGSFFLLSPDDCSDLGLETGAVADRAAIADASRRHTRTRIQTRATDLLARREHSVAELRRKLQQRGFEGEAIEPVVEQFIEAGYLSDERFCESFIRSRLGRHPEGRAMLAARLAQKGVARPIVDRALDREFSDEAAAEALEAAYAKVSRRTDDSERIVAALVRRGFPHAEVRRLISREL